MLCCSEFVFEDMLVYNNSEYLLPLLTPADPFVFVLERCSVTFVVLFIVGYLSRSPICCFCLREWNVKVHKTVNVNAPTDLVYLFFFSFRFRANHRQKSSRTKWYSTKCNGTKSYFRNIYHVATLCLHRFTNHSCANIKSELTF